MVVSLHQNNKQTNKQTARPTEPAGFNMKRTINGYYTQRHTSNTIAIINGKGFRVAYLPNKITGKVEKVITNEKLTFLDSYLNDEEEFIFEPLRK